MKIYAIDDEPYMLEALLETIQGSKAFQGAELRGFCSARELLLAMVQEPCQVVFLDIQLPGMDGLTLAKRLQELKEDVDIIFVTGYDQYKGEAMDLYASAYLLKPVTPDKVMEACRHLRYARPQPVLLCRAITFGNFSLYVNGSPVVFHRRKSSELLAYLVAKLGAVVSRVELTMALYEDESHSLNSRKKLDNAIHTMLEDLRTVGAEELIHRSSNGLAVNRQLLSSDLYDYFDGNKQLYHGEFLEQYSWCELFRGYFGEGKM